MTAAALILCELLTLHDVTTQQARKQTLLEYVASRDDLSKKEIADWDRALRGIFGGTAIKDGNDEGVTVAKSVVSGAIFHSVDPTRGAKAAYEAYHDTLRWVPPPIAINYQLLSFQGRKPKATSRELAFRFSRYFNEDLAPELVSWWQDMLDAKKINPNEVGELQTTLSEVRLKMRPMFLERLWQLAALEAQAPSNDRDNAITQIKKEISRAFAKVAKNPTVYSTSDSYDRYRLLAEELGVSPQARPAAAPRPSAVIKIKEPPAPTKPVRPNTSVGFLEAPAAPPETPSASARGNLPPIGGPLLLVPANYPNVLDKIVNGWVKTPYLWGGTTRAGVDCSGFVRAVYRESLDVELPRNSRSQFATGVNVSWDELKVGDLVFFDTLERGTVTHVGIYAGKGTLAHASSSVGVTRASLDAKYYRRAYYGSRRLLTVQ